MTETNIYSIGHGTKKFEDFISELKSFNIEFLIDVRSRPYSKYNPQYNKESLQNELEKEEIKYVFLGDKLGGVPNDPACYLNGKVEYNLIKEKSFFKEGLERLKLANEKNIKVAVMCSESKPEECHRSKLIGQELLKINIFMMHILAINVVKDQQTVLKELLNGKHEIDLFGIETGFTSRKIYK